MGEKETVLLTVQTFLTEQRKLHVQLQTEEGMMLESAVVPDLVTDLGFTWCSKSTWCGRGRELRPVFDISPTLWGEKGPLEGLPLRSPSQCLEIPFSPLLHICLFLVSFSYSSCTSHLFGMPLTFLIVLYSVSPTKRVKEISSMSLIIC